MIKVSPFMFGSPLDIKFHASNARLQREDAMCSPDIPSTPGYGSELTPVQRSEMTSNRTYACA